MRINLTLVKSPCWVRTLRETRKHSEKSATPSSVHFARYKERAPATVIPTIPHHVSTLKGCTSDNQFGEDSRFGERNLTRILRYGCNSSATSKYLHRVVRKCPRVCVRVSQEKKSFVDIPPFAVSRARARRWRWAAPSALFSTVKIISEVSTPYCGGIDKHRKLAQNDMYKYYKSMHNVNMTLYPATTQALAQSLQLCYIAHKHIDASALAAKYSAGSSGP
ncbi:hypothetical protein B566_EDAN007925 [Ephemera danica]|nr:hypothetical protein B566_EDAN007925 [Ephemera danica]